MTTGYLPSVKFLADPSWSPGQSGAKWENVTSAGLGKPEPLDKAKDPNGNRPVALDLVAAIRENRQPNGSIYDGRAAHGNDRGRLRIAAARQAGRHCRWKTDKTRSRCSHVSGLLERHGIVLGCHR